MDAKKDDITPPPQRRRQPRNLVIGLRVLTALVTISGIVVASIPAPRNFIAIGILGPAFVTTFCWSVVDLLATVVNFLPAARPTFSLVIDCIIAIGSIICLLCFGLFRDWWPGGSALNHSEGSLSRDVLFQVALGLGCAST
ncbi:hypothetical protein CC79DRAFT_172206 [Sarocladium strictum]